MSNDDNENQRAEALAHGFLSGRISHRQLLRRGALFGGAAVAATTLGPLLAACSSSTSTSETGGKASSSAGTPVSGGTLTAALTGNPSSLDPAASGIYTDLQVLDNIFDKLIAMDENGKLVGELATTWTQDSPTP